MKRLLETFVLGLILFLNFYLVQEIEVLVQDQPNSKLIAQVVSGIISVSFFFIYLVNQNGLRKFRSMRRNFLAPIPAKYEGYWISSVKTTDHGNDDRTFSLSKIYYDQSRKSWFHQGFEFSDNGHCTGEWRVESINFSERRGLWFFRGSTWKHEKEDSEIYSEKFTETDQLSFISVAPKIENHLISRFFNDPISAGKKTITSGRAEMARVTLEEMKGWFDEFAGAIDHPRVRKLTEAKIGEIKDYLNSRIEREPEVLGFKDRMLRRIRHSG